MRRASIMNAWLRSPPPPPPGFHGTQVLQGFQKFGLPQFQGGAGPSVLASCMQGLQYSVRCLAQLTATQYACTTRPGAAPPTNEGRIIFLTALKK